MNIPQIQRIIYERNLVWIKPSIIEQIATLALKQHQRTPTGNLRDYRDALGTYAFNALRRAGFDSIEQVAAAPDAELLKIRNMGPVSLQRIRAVTP